MKRATLLQLFARLSLVTMTLEYCRPLLFVITEINWCFNLYLRLCCRFHGEKIPEIFEYWYWFVAGNIHNNEALMNPLKNFAHKLKLVTVYDI